MSKITEFDIKDFLEEEERYYNMLNRIKDRVIEIANDYGIINGRCYINDLDIYEEEDDEYRIAAELSGDYLSWEADYLFSDEYKEEARKCKAKKEAEEKEREYQEYLRLKEKFEGTCEKALDE